MYYVVVSIVKKNITYFKEFNFGLWYLISFNLIRSTKIEKIELKYISLTQIWFGERN